MKKLKMHLQFFGRQKNARTSYFVAPPVEGNEVPEWMELAKYINSVTDDSDENVESTAYYDGDGTAEDDVTSVSEKYTFEGLFDEEDPAQKFIAGLRRNLGEGRKIMFKVVDPNGDVYSERATASEIKFRGGEADEYAPFNCTITFDRLPQKEDGTGVQALSPAN